MAVVGARVALGRQEDYESEGLREALRLLLNHMGGMAAFVQPGERVALKPNLLLGASPERAITTHPAVVEAVAAEVRAAGGHPLLVESPGAGIPHTRGALERVFRKTGMAELARRTNLELVCDSRARMVSHPGGRLIHRVDVVTALVEADAVISLPKLKTHTYMTFTGAVKNLFGAVPGLQKPAYHAKLPDPALFAEMLLDVVSLIRPRLHVMDGILALEGDGPGSAGRPRQAGLLLASVDPVALDAVACRLVGLPEENVPTLVAARERGLWSGRIEDIEMVGGRLEDLFVADFLAPIRAPDPTGYRRTGRLLRLLREAANEAINPRPRPKAGRCTACGSCVRACPTGAIRVEGRLARVETKECIRCFCCHELCPEAAIDLELRGLGRLARSLGLM